MRPLYTYPYAVQVLVVVAVVTVLIAGLAIFMMSGVGDATCSDCPRP